MKTLKKIFLLFTLTVISVALQAQKKQWEEIAKDSSYKVFQAKLKELSQMAKGKQTNFAAVKKLFLDNKIQLEALATRYKVDLAQPVKDKPAVGNKTKIIPLQGVRAVDNGKALYKAPFKIKDALSDNRYARQYTKLDFYDNEGRATYSFLDNGLFADQPTALRQIGYKEVFWGEKIKIPNNPLYVAARIEIEYSYLYTGWDTYGAYFQPMVGLFVSDNFRSVEFSNLPGFMYEQRWKQIALADYRFQIWENASIKDFMFSKDTSFQIEGYITPGSEITIKAGFGMTSGNSIGNYGSYHYAEFQLKKIIVTYLKAD
jgi:hypothetical protein